MLIIGISMLFIAGCGGSSGPGVDSPSASLSLVLDKTAMNSGDSIVATVQLTSAVAGKALNGLNVWVRSSDNTVITDSSGTTNTDGKANIVLRANTITSSRTVTLLATMEGITQSTSLQVIVSPQVLPKGPTLTVNLPLTSAASFKAGGGKGRIILSGTNIKLVDDSLNPISGQSVTLYVESITGQQIGEYAFYAVPGGEIIAPPGVLNMTTDTNGSATIPMGVEMFIPGVAGAENNMIVNWRATTFYLGQMITVTGQAAFKITAT
jgi:hypothetical protein